MISAGHFETETWLDDTIASTLTSFKSKKMHNSFSFTTAEERLTLLCWMIRIADEGGEILSQFSRDELFPPAAPPGGDMRALWSSSVAQKVNSRHKALHPVIIGWLFTQGQKTNEEVTLGHRKRWGLFFKQEGGFMGTIISVHDLLCVDACTYSAPICKTV